MASSTGSVPCGLRNRLGCIPTCKAQLPQHREKRAAERLGMRGRAVLSISTGRQSASTGTRTKRSWKPTDSCRSAPSQHRPPLSVKTARTLDEQQPQRSTEKSAWLQTNKAEADECEGRGTQHVARDASLPQRSQLCSGVEQRSTGAQHRMTSENEAENDCWKAIYLQAAGTGTIVCVRGR